jgi:murein DD-endopeptidase MepM/ murein hydrolase activator NlpD
MKPWHVAAAFAAALLLPFLILFGIIVGILGSPARVCGAASPAQVGGGAPAVTANAVGLPAVAGYGGEQLAAAAEIARAAADAGFGADAQTLGIAVSMGESGLRPLNYGDAAGPNSRGYFQQRDWGPVADELDPYKSATMFYTGGQHGEPGLNSIAGWQTMTPTAAAHAVQRNADPNYYTKFYAPAQQVLAALGGSLPPGPGAAAAGCPGTPVQAAGAPVPVGAGGWTRPAVGRLSSGFSATVVNRGDAGTGVHLGQDIANTCGTPIYAAAGGVNPDGTPNGKPATVISSGPASGFGNWIRLDHGNGYITVYGHMKKADLMVAAGDTVTAGQQISRIGSEGQSTGCHLHLGVMISGAYVDPLSFLAAHGVALSGTP